MKTRFTNGGQDMARKNNGPSLIPAMIKYGNLEKRLRGYPATRYKQSVSYFILAVTLARQLLARSTFILLLPSRNFTFNVRPYKWHMQLAFPGYSLS